MEQRPRPPLSAGRATLRNRPCDACRSRKTRCVKPQDQDKCVLCSFHGKACTYLRDPPPRPRRQPGPPSPRATRAAPVPETPKTAAAAAAPAAAVQAAADDATPESARRESESWGSDTSLSLLDGTLSLDLDTHPEYVGATSHKEPALLDLQRLEPPRADVGNGASQPRPDRLARRVDERTMFLIRPDESAASEAQRVADCDAIAECTAPLGSTLVALYFAVVHHSFPILHKAVFLSKHAVSHRTFSPPLLAAVYLIALDYQLYDPAIAGGALALARPDGPAALEALASRTMADDVRRPKLSTLQAGLLLLQRGVPSSWLFTAQMVALAQELGLHVDCGGWSIPPWEKGLRRRLAWALYMQDRWAAFVHGRPPLLHDDDWDVQACTLADFAEADEEAETAEGWGGEETGGRPEDTAWQELFIQHAQLAQILADIMARYYAAAATRPGGRLDRMGAVAAVEMAKPLLGRLRAWAAALPTTLRLESAPSRPHQLSANGGLHLAYIAAEVAVHRALVRLLTPATPVELAAAVRRAAQTRVQTALTVLESLRPAHTEAFCWGSAAAQQVAQIGSLAALLWATAETADEMQWCARQIDALRWMLRLRSQAAGFFKEALQLLERDIISLGLELG